MAVLPRGTCQRPGSEAMFGEHEDLVDSSTQAIIRFRKLDSDEADTPFEPKAGAYY